jgi:hypothetical protein
VSQQARIPTQHLRGMLPQMVAATPQTTHECTSVPSALHLSVRRGLAPPMPMTAGLVAGACAFDTVTQRTTGVQDIQVRHTPRRFP